MKFGEILSKPPCKYLQHEIWRTRCVRQLILKDMKLKVVVHEAEEGGYWAEVPSIPGCATQGETFEELLGNLYEAIEGCLSVEVIEW